MAITLGATISSKTEDNANISGGWTYSHTVDAASTLLVVSVAASRGGGRLHTPTGVTFNGVSLTKAIESDSSLTSGSSLWYLISPDITTANVVVSWSDTDSSGAISSATNIKGTVTSSVIGNTATAKQIGGNFTSATVDCTSSAAGNMVFDAMAALGAADQSLSEGADQTETYEGYSGTTRHLNLGNSYEIGTGTRTMSWSWGVNAGNTFTVAAEIISNPNSPSASVSPSSSTSTSASVSPSSSTSQSASVSPSASVSASVSPSPSISPSASTSPSASLSPSTSASPSPSPAYFDLDVKSDFVTITGDTRSSAGTFSTDSKGTNTITLDIKTIR